MSIKGRGFTLYKSPYTLTADEDVETTYLRMLDAKLADSFEIRFADGTKKSFREWKAEHGDWP